MKKQRGSKIVKLSFPVMADEVREFILDRWMKGEILYEKTGEGYIVIHPVYGRLGDLSLSDRGEETRLAFTPSSLPNGNEARAQGLTIDSMFKGRETENEKFYTALLEFLHSSENKIQDPNEVRKEMVRKHTLLGKTDDQIALLLNVDKKTVYRDRKEMGLEKNKKRKT